MTTMDARPLIVHIVHRFGVGGLENGLANLLNRLPPALARHCVLSLTSTDPEFARRVRTPDVEFVALDKPTGQTARILPAVYRVLRERRPCVVHTRNIATLECQLAAWAARVPVRMHGEHGWDVNDLHGSSRRYAWLRRMVRPFVHHQVALSRRTARYLQDVIRVAPSRVTELCNGVDVDRFAPSEAGRSGALLREAPDGWKQAEDPFVVGTVGRLATVKNQRLLCEAFLALREANPSFRRHGRLLIVGDGPDHGMLEDMLRSAGAFDAAWFAGERGDVPAWLGLMDLFCLPSLAEGISNGILEAMACGLPVVATDVGGNAELVEHGVTGCLVNDFDAASMASAIDTYFSDRDRRTAHGQAARARAVARFSLTTMVASYESLYARLMAETSARTAHRSREKRSCAG